MLSSKTSPSPKSEALFPPDREEAPRQPRGQEAAEAITFDPDGEWRAFYRAANAPVSLVERFSAFRTLHPQRQIQQEGASWRYRASGGGRPLLLLGARFGGSDFAWRLIELLERRFRVLAVDYPALAQADAMVRGLSAILAAERLSGAAVLGAGFGGLLAQRFADRRPDQTYALALLNAPAPLPRLANRYAGRAALLERLPPRWARELERRRFERLLASPPEERRFWRGYTDEVFAEQRPAGRSAALLRAAADLHAIGGDSPSGLHRPVLIAETEGDRGAPQPALRRLPARFPQAERLCFAYSAGHTVEITRAREIAHAFEQLLSRG